MFVFIPQVENHPILFDGHYKNATDPHIVTGSGLPVPQYVIDFIYTDFDDTLLQSDDPMCLVVSTDK